MFIVIACMLAGMATGYMLRRRKLGYVHRTILTLIWVLLFLLGLEVGSNETVVNQFAKLGFEAFLLAFGATLGSVFLAWMLWLVVLKKSLSR